MIGCVMAQNANNLFRIFATNTNDKMFSYTNLHVNWNKLIFVYVGVVQMVFIILNG